MFVATSWENSWNLKPIIYNETL